MLNQQKEDKCMNQEIVDLGGSKTCARGHSIYTLSIIGQIEGHQVQPETVKTTKYEHVLPLLAAIEESEEIDGLLLLLNTVGGDIEAGLAIAELIAGSTIPVPEIWIEQFPASFPILLTPATARVRVPPSAETVAFLPS